jgi:Amt family ammonium transporter
VVLSNVLLNRLKLDDPVGAVSAHGTAGIWGVMAVVISQAGAEDGATFGGQLMGVFTIFAWTLVVSGIFWLIIKSLIGIRVSEEDEYGGVDISECGVEAYPEFGSGSTVK